MNRQMPAFNVVAHLRGRRFRLGFGDFAVPLRNWMLRFVHASVMSKAQAMLYSSAPIGGFVYGCGSFLVLVVYLVEGQAAAAASDVSRAWRNFCRPVIAHA